MNVFHTNRAGAAVAYHENIYLVPGLSTGYMFSRAFYWLLDIDVIRSSSMISISTSSLNSIQFFYSHLLQQNTIYFIGRKKCKRAEQFI